MRITLLFIFLLFIFPKSIFAQEKGIPFITNFSPKDYKAESQNWCFIQNNEGLIYVGNNMGVLEYDGISWQLARTKTVVRSLAIDTITNKVYVGAIGDIGYLEKNDEGSLNFISLLNKIPEEHREFGSVWATLATSEGILFRLSAQKMLRWDGNEITLMESSPSVSHLGTQNPIFFNRNRGLLRPDGNSFVPIEGTNRLPQTINSIIPYSDKAWLVRTNDSFAVLNSSNDGSLKTFKNQASTFLFNNRSRRPIAGNDFIGYATLESGVVILDKTLNVQSVIDKNVGLQTNECYTIFEDNQNNLWVGTGNGISKIEVNSPISRFNDALGLDAGAVLGIVRHKGVLYTGGLGSFYLQNGKFNLVEGSLAQVWGYLQFKTSTDTLLLVGTTGGLLEIKDRKANLVALEGATIRSFIQSDIYPNRVYVGRSTGLSIIDRFNGKWKLKATLPNFSLEVRNIVEEPDGTLWLGTEYEGCVKVVLDEDDISQSEIKNYQEESGLPSLISHRMYLHNEEVLSANDGGIYKYDQQSDKFIPYEKFGLEFTNGNRPVMYFIRGNAGKVWVSAFKNNEHPIGYFEKQLDQDEYQWNDLALRRLPPMEIEAMYPESNGVIWIGGSDGLFRYDSKIEKDYTAPYNALIRKVILNGDSVVNLNTTGKVQIPYKDHDITFTYAATSFEDPEALLFSYKLDNYEEKWSDWAPETRKEYTLSEGNYVFNVKSKNIYGVESSVATYEFRVLAPWYRSIIAYISYVLLLIGLVYGVVYFNTKRLQAQNKKLEELIESRTLEVRQQNEELEVQKVEILSQRNDIEKQKNEIEKAYDNIQTISEVGQKITSTLDFEKLIRTIYRNVNQLLDAPAFGVGIYNERTQSLEFKGFIEKGEKLPFFADGIHDTSKLSSWCFNNLKPVIINDLKNEFNEYIDGDLSTKIGELTESAVYVPLIVENEPIGVITMQSFKKNAYSNLQLTIIQTLASYIAVAVDNAKAYEVIKANNAHITDSIRYAETIQQAILPSREKMNEALHEYFVLYKPKDIVSGDFYWFNHIEDKIFIAVTDCTGHGVPGAFMSIVGTNLLNEIVNVEQVHDPAKILALLDKYVTLSLRQNEVNNIDGMDIALIVLESHEDFTTTVTFAGAKRPMYYFENGELHKVEGVRKSIGGGKRISRKERKFFSKVITLQSDTSLYLLSDGYVDQNDANRQRFGSWRLKEILKEIALLPMHKQEEILNHYLSEHMRGTSQRDDITILGLRIV